MDFQQATYARCRGDYIRPKLIRAVADWVDDPEKHPKPPALGIAHEIVNWSKRLGGAVLPCGPSLADQPRGLMNALEWALAVEKACVSYKRSGDYDTLRKWREANPGAAQIMRLVKKVRKDASNN